MGRTIAIDYGRKRTGIAVSDPMGIIATPLETVRTCDLEDFLVKYIAQNHVVTIVVGEPRQSDGSPSQTYPQAKALRDKLIKLYPDIDVVFFDERFTTVLAKRAMIEGGVSKSARRDKSLADRISAAIILQGWLESRHNNEKREDL